MAVVHFYNFFTAELIKVDSNFLIPNFKKV